MGKFLCIEKQSGFLLFATKFSAMGVVKTHWFNATKFYNTVNTLINTPSLINSFFWSQGGAGRVYYRALAIYRVFIVSSFKKINYWNIVENCRSLKKHLVPFKGWFRINPHQQNAQDFVVLLNCFDASEWWWGILISKCN